MWLKRWRLFVPRVQDRDGIMAWVLNKAWVENHGRIFYKVCVQTRMALLFEEFRERRCWRLFVP